MIRFLKHFAAIAIIFPAVLLAENVAAQSLEIHVNRSKINVEATSSLDLGYRVQASSDFATWEDVSDQASGPFQYSVNLAQDQMRYFRLRTWETESAPITLIMIGDSTVANLESNLNKFYGWGHGVFGYMKPNVTVVNFATPLQSTRTFLSSIEKDRLELIKPDFVLVQFGLVDGYYPGSQIPLSEYEANLKTIVQFIRGFKGTPILVTPPVNRSFGSTGKITPYLEDHSEVMRRLSAELQTYLIDLNKLSADLYNSLGQSGSTYISFPGDPSHFSEAGAEVIAGLVVDAFPSILRSQASE